MQEFALLPRMFSRREGTARNVFARRHGNGDLKQLERIEIIMSSAFLAELLRIESRFTMAYSIAVHVSEKVTELIEQTQFALQCLCNYGNGPWVA